MLSDVLLHTWLLLTFRRPSSELPVEQSAAYALLVLAGITSVIKLSVDSFTVPMALIVVTFNTLMILWWTSKRPLLLVPLCLVMIAGDLILTPFILLDQRLISTIPSLWHLAVLINVVRIYPKKK